MHVRSCFNSTLSASAPITFTIASLISGKWASCCVCDWVRAGCARTTVDVATQNINAIIERRSAGALAIVQASAFRECYRNANCEDLYDLDQFFGELILINSSRIPRVDCRWPPRWTDGN